LGGAHSGVGGLTGRVITSPSGVVTNVRVMATQSQVSSDVVNLATQLVSQAMFDGQRIPLCPPEKVCAETLLLCRVLGLREKSLDELARLAVSGLITPRMRRLCRVGSVDVRVGRRAGSGLGEEPQTSGAGNVGATNAAVA
jgi:hypothetical protein